MTTTHSNGIVKPQYWAILYLVCVALAGCGGGQSDRSGDQGLGGDLQVRMQWQTHSVPLMARQEPPSGNVCVDFGITGIRIRVKNASNRAVAKTKILTCDDRSARLEGIAVQSGLTVEAEGFVDDKVKWFGEQKEVEVIAGQGTEVNVTMNFTGEATSPPAAEIVPADGQANVSTDSVITVRFDKAVVEASVKKNAIKVFRGEDQVAGKITYNPDTFEAVFDPDEDLAISTSYTVTVTTAVMDLSGQLMEQEAAVRFTTTTVWYVDASATASGDGQSWSDAFLTIAEAVDAAEDGDHIWVRQGVYPPSRQINVDKAVELLGGFEGIEIQHHQRDWKARETVVDGRGERRCFYVAADAVIDGFTITGGHLSSDYIPKGGAMYIASTSPLISNCNFVENVVVPNDDAGMGGALFIDNGDPIIKNCTFQGNRIIDAVFSFGGVMHIENGGLEISDCIFKNNRISASSVSLGGVIYSENANVTITNCLFDANTADGDYGRAGVIFNFGGELLISGCRFSNNSAYGQESAAAGAMMNQSSEVRLENCLFIANQAILSEDPVLPIAIPSYGGAIAVSDSSISITNCSISDNAMVRLQPVSYETKGGAISIHGGSLTMMNSILWGNEAYLDNEIFSDEDANLNISFSNLQQSGLGGTHNMRKDPLFGADLHLQFDSPCRGKGDSGSAPQTDIDGEERPSETAVDIGADQFVDGDGDRMPDYWEKAHDVNSADSDPDGDRLTNLEEYRIGTDPSQVQPVSYTALSGAVRDDGFHRASDLSTPTGTSRNGELTRSFFVFDLAGFKPVKSAVLRLKLEDYDTEDTEKLILIQQVDTAVDILAADTNGQPGIDVFYDLGHGNQYGQFKADPTDIGAILDIRLTRDGVETLNAAIEASGHFIIGVKVGLESSGLLLFGEAGDDRVHQLVMVEE